MAQSHAALENGIGYRFQDQGLLERALTHRSYQADAGLEVEHNERLEFLGDAVLGFLASDRLFQQLPDSTEGRLTKIKASLVSAEALAPVARDLGLSELLRLGRVEERNGGRQKKGLIVDALEALIAAVYLDGGIAAAGAVVDRLILSADAVRAAERNLETTNAKSTLQELLQARGLPTPEYRLVEASGPDHALEFEIELRIGERFQTRASASPKRVAEQRAALEALERQAEWLEETGPEGVA